MVTAPLTRKDLREELALFREEIRTHFATKADLANLENRLTWRFGSALIAVGTLVVLAVKYLPGGAS